MILEINNQPVDYVGAIALTRQTFDANNLGLKLLDITNNITLPKTENNKRIILGANKLESDALDVLYDCKVIDSYIIFAGVGYLKNTGKEWKLQLVDGSKVFFEQISKDLNELDLENEDFVYGSSAYNALKNLSASPWVWSIVQMHKTVAASDLQYLRPHFSVWSLLQKIFNSRGYTLNADTNIIQNLAIQSNSEDFKFTSYQKTLNGNSLSSLLINDFVNVVTPNYDSINLGTVKQSFKVRGMITSDAGATFKFNDDIIEIKIGTNYYDEETSELEGDVTISLVGSATFDNVLLYTLISENSFDNIATFNPNGYKVKCYDNMPKFSQKDLLMDALTFSNSIIVPDTLNKAINLKSLSNISTQNKIDWTAKFIDDSETITSSVDGLAKVNKLSYDNNVGDSFFNSSLAYLKDGKEYIKLRYSGSTDKQDYAVYNTYELDKDNNNVRTDGDGLHIVLVDGIYGKFAPINWLNLKVNYYEALFNSFNKPRQIEAMFNLSKLDVVGFDPLRLVYLQQYNSIFLVQSIDGWQPNELTSVKLLKIDMPISLAGVIPPPPAPILATVTTDSVSNIQQTTATSGGDVTSDGGATVTERGICYSLTANPTTADTKVITGNGLGLFISNMTGLISETAYHVRAYAINSVGTAYGEDRTFTTESQVLTYGNLYNYYAAIDANFAPSGWGLITLEAALEIETNGTPASFYEQRGGFRHAYGTFEGLNGIVCLGMFADVTGGDMLWYGYLSPTEWNVYPLDPQTGRSVRLLYTDGGAPPSTVTDYDGNVYDVIQIGSYYLTLQNWKCTRLNNGGAIPIVTDDTQWSELTTLARCAYNNDPNNV